MMAFLIRRRHPSAIFCSTFSPSKNSCVVTERDRLRELMSIFAFVKRLFDGLSKLHVINDAQDKIRFWNFAEFFKRLILSVLFRVGIKPSKELRSADLLRLGIVSKPIQKLVGRLTL